ncbi:MAG: ribosome maturation factor RimM [Defluviitaleaceae bacterium]|nr:ribosome maturation factor RimM [Defluviitaleaceae bacterium]
MDTFEIGIIVKPQGIRGELRVLPTTDDPGRFQLLEGQVVFVSSKDGAVERKLTRARLHKGLVLVTLEGVDDRNAAEEIINCTISIPAEKALPLGQDEYFVRDLIGMEVVTEDGVLLGKVARVLPTPANDVYVIDAAEGDNFMIPAIKQVVRKVGDGKIVVRLMDGMRELTV